jgi:hypothetical protein
LSSSVSGNQLLAQVAPRAFGKHRVLAQQLHAQLEVAGGLTVLANPHVAGGHAFDGAVVAVQDFGRSKAREYFNPQPFRPVLPATWSHAPRLTM